MYQGASDIYALLVSGEGHLQALLLVVLGISSRAIWYPREQLTCGGAQYDPVTKESSGAPS